MIEKEIMKLHIVGRDWSTLTTGSIELRLTKNAKEVMLVCGERTLDGSVQGVNPIFYSADQRLDVTGDERLLLPRSAKGRC